MKAIAIAACLFLSACGFTQTETKPIVVDKPKFVAPQLAPAVQLPVQWIVITKDNMHEKLAELEKTNGAVVLFALTPDGYQAMSLNGAELRRYIQQLNATILAMRRYYESSDNE